MNSLDQSYVVVDGQFGPVPRPAPSNATTEHPSLKDGYVPGSGASCAHDWSPTATGGGISTHGRHFIDRYNRVCLLRGVNLAGSIKIPSNHNPATFFSAHQTVSFVGKPFPLEETREHFARLRRWGLTFVRFLVTWEAIEHAGPGQYDQEYLSYIHSVISLLPEYGLSAFVSMHQDVWSRHSGGSGAPAWTLQQVGFDLENLEEAGAAWLTGVRGFVKTESENMERGIWPTGYQKLSASTMATCFWGGNTFAPQLKVKGKHGKQTSIQDFLQDAFLDCWQVLAEKVGHLPGVIGFEPMNEPHRGYIGLPSMHKFDYNTDLHLHDYPSAFQSFMLGAGHTTTVPHYTRFFPWPTRLTSATTRNLNEKKAWSEVGATSGQCLWEMHGVWGWDNRKQEGVVLRENYFSKSPIDGHEVDWYIDHYYPFMKKWASRVRQSAGQDKLVFLEPIPNEFCPASWTPEHQIDKMVFSPHWYDLRALFGKVFGNFSVNVQGLSRNMFILRALYWGQDGVRANYLLQLRNIVEAGYRSLGERPILVGECGIPMDMNKGEAFKTGDFSWQEKMMDALLHGLEQNLIGFTLWNYNPDSTDADGDHWNAENFSWFSRSHARTLGSKSFNQDDATLDQGARLLPSIVRPYPAKIAGIPILFEYDMNSGDILFEWTNPAFESPVPSPASVPNPPLSGHPEIKARETEIFIPSTLATGKRLLLYGLQPEEFKYDESRQTLYLLPKESTPGHVHRIAVVFSPAATPRFRVTTHWQDLGHYYATVLVLIGALAFAFARAQ